MSCYQRSTHIAQVEQGGRYFVSDLDGNVVVLQDSAALIWQCVDGSDVDDIAQTVAYRFGLEGADIREDTRRFLESLREAGLVTCD